MYTTKLLHFFILNYYEKLSARDIARATTTAAAMYYQYNIFFS